MDFESALEYLETFISYEKDRNFIYNEKSFDLNRFRKAVDEMGVDYAKLKFVHVAGSKGKGSVSNFIAEYLVRDGYKVGLFTSPHLRDVRERIKLNGQMVSKEKFAEYIALIKKFLDENGVKITYFEVLTLVALQFFVDEGVDYAVLEVGMGGRLDSTNIVIPELSVLTSVEMEHADILGDTLSKILDEKLGIVKDGVPLLVGVQSEEAMHLIKEKIVRKVDVHYVDDFDVEFEVYDEARMQNLKIAWCAILIILGGAVNGTLKRDIEDFKLEGRFDIREIDGKTVVFDVAHTINSMKNLLNSLDKRFPGKEYKFLTAFRNDKQKEKMLDLIREFSSDVEYISLDDDIERIYKKMLSDTKRDQVFVVTGSHYLVGRVIPF